MRVESPFPMGADGTCIDPRFQEDLRGNDVDSLVPVPATLSLFISFPSTPPSPLSRFSQFLSGQ